MKSSNAPPSPAPSRSKQAGKTAHPGSSVLDFKLNAGGKTYEGTVTVPPGPGTCTLPMMINSLMVNLAAEHPLIHEARAMKFTGRLLS